MFVRSWRPFNWAGRSSGSNRGRKILQSTGFARDYHMTAEIAAERDGKVKALRVKTLADHGAFNAAAQPSKFPAGLFSICTGSYDFSEAFCEVDGVYTNKAPGGIAYRCSFRVTEAAYLIERAMDVLAQELKMDPVELRLKNFIPPEKFPVSMPVGMELRQRQLQGCDGSGAGKDRISVSFGKNRRKNGEKGS